MIVDIFSRKIVGAEVYEQELGELAATVLQRAVWSEKCVKKGTTLHSDNGAQMRSFTMQAKMRDLGVASSYSRPRVSNDNPYSESLFRTTKYHHSWPKDGFKNIDEAREWVANLISWYNKTHKHSGIKYVPPRAAAQWTRQRIISEQDQNLPVGTKRESVKMAQPHSQLGLY